LPGIAVTLDEHRVARLPALDDGGGATVARPGRVWGSCSFNFSAPRTGPSAWGYRRWASRRSSRHRTCCCTAESPLVHGSGSSGTSMVSANASSLGSLTPLAACNRPRLGIIAGDP
jgi:hypothetical protein